MTESGDGGFSTPQWVAMVSMSMLMLALILNLITIQYGLGAVRAAVDEAARAGSVLGGSRGTCVSHANRALRGDSGLLRGRMGSNVIISCAVSGDVLVASAQGSFEMWVRGLPAVSFDVEGRSVIERAP